MSSSSEEAKCLSEADAYPESEESMLFMHIFETGLKTCSPKVLLGMMPPSAKQQINTEHIKSRLQKYRNNDHRSKGDFTKFYEQEFKDSFAEWHKKAVMKQEDIDGVQPNSLVHVVEVEQARRMQPSSETIGTLSNLRSRSANGTVAYPSQTKTLKDQEKGLIEEFAELQDIIAAESKQFQDNIMGAFYVLKKDE